MKVKPPLTPLKPPQAPGRTVFIPSLIQGQDFYVITWQKYFILSEVIFGKDTMSQRGKTVRLSVSYVSFRYAHTLNFCILPFLEARHLL